MHRGHIFARRCWLGQRSGLGDNYDCRHCQSHRHHVRSRREASPDYDAADYDSADSDARRLRLRRLRLRRRERLHICCPYFAVSILVVKLNSSTRLARLRTAHWTSHRISRTLLRFHLATGPRYSQFRRYSERSFTTSRCWGSGHRAKPCSSNSVTVTQAAPTTAPPTTAPPTTAPPTTAPPTTAPPTTAPPTTAPPAPTGPPLDSLSAPSWSGYAATGGPFTSISGTFTVPYLTTDATCGDTLSDWVGIDGWRINNDLIQAGVSESEVDPRTGACSPNFYITPWWEILPALSTPVDSMTVHAGDSVTVSLQQVSAGLWEISLTDNTDGQSFSVQQPFSGSGQTAEWVTEANGGQHCGSGLGPAPGFPGYAMCPLAPFSPPVTFGNLQLPQSSLVTEVDEISMVQTGNTVSTRPTCKASQVFYLMAYTNIRDCWAATLLATLTLASSTVAIPADPATVARYQAVET